MRTKKVGKKNDPRFKKGGKAPSAVKNASSNARRALKKSKSSGAVSGPGRKRKAPGKIGNGSFGPVASKKVTVKKRPTRSRRTASTRSPTRQRKKVPRRGRGAVAGPNARSTRATKRSPRHQARGKLRRR